MVQGWDCFLVNSECADRVAGLVRAYTRKQIGFIHDLNFQLSSPANRFSNPSVRLLASQDSSLLSAAPPEVAGTGYRGIEEFLREAIVVAAIVDGLIVSLAYTTSQSQRYADVGVYTLKPYRRRGFARAAASLVSTRVQARGRTPVWSTGHFNTASLAVARDIGFTEVSRRTYVVTDRIENWKYAQ